MHQSGAEMRCGGRPRFQGDYTGLEAAKCSLNRQALYQINEDIAVWGVGWFRVADQRDRTGNTPHLPLDEETRKWYKSNEAQPMKRVFGLLYAFPAVLLLARTSPPEHPADDMSTLGTPSVEQLASLPKRFPPEMMLSSWTTGLREGKLAHSYCVYPTPDRKSLSVKRCESVPVRFRLVSPFGVTAPEKNPAK
jgi:hypothetical protein